jgi:hypothetical protein
VSSPDCEIEHAAVTISLIREQFHREATVLGIFLALIVKYRRTKSAVSVLQFQSKTPVPYYV